jgi:hypothetical protein
VNPLSRQRRFVVLGGPLLLIPFSLAHGLDWLVMHGMHDDYDAFIQYIVDIRGRWLAVHVVGLALFPLLGLAVWWMLPPSRIASRISRAGLAVYIVLYAAFDAIAGIGSAVVADYRVSVPADDRPLIDGVMWNLLGEADATFYLAEVASYAWAVGTGAAAVALWQDLGWRVALPLALGGLAMWHSHFPPFGAIAGAFLSIAAWQFLAHPGQTTQRPAATTGP